MPEGHQQLQDAMIELLLQRLVDRECTWAVDCGDINMEYARLRYVNRRYEVVENECRRNCGYLDEDLLTMKV